MSLDTLSARLAASAPSAESRLIDILTEPLDDAIDALGEEVVIRELQALYDKYVAPADTPWVPEIVERTVVDPMARSLIATAVKRFHARIHKD
jgi:hypothetical protein